MLGQWLDWTLDGAPPSPCEGRFPSGSYRLLAPGIIELTPDKPGSNAHACVFSAAIHGNETAPVELLGAWLCALEAGTTRLGAPTLVILGNITALKAQQRFITTNLNRLFKRDLTGSGPEFDRARELMAAVDAFYALYPASTKLHYDLHTAIRGSVYTRFVVEPYTDLGINRSEAHDTKQWEWLAAADMQAVLHQHQHSWTFSHYSKHYHDAQAFTFELGRVAPFGQNDMASLAAMLRLLSDLGAGQQPATSPLQSLMFFQVKHELFRHSEAFSLCFDDQVPNFSRFEPGSRIAKDAVAGDFIVGDTPLYVVFPNAQVEIGSRAALLVASQQPAR